MCLCSLFHDKYNKIAKARLVQQKKHPTLFYADLESWVTSWVAEQLTAPAKKRGLVHGAEEMAESDFQQNIKYSQRSHPFAGYNPKYDVWK